MNVYTYHELAARAFPERTSLEAQRLLSIAVQRSKAAGTPPAIDPETGMITEAAIRSWVQRSLKAGISQSLFGRLT